MAARTPRLQPGAVCGAYRIIRLLGQGGMGEVYEAEEDNGRRVAFKVLTAARGNDVNHERFLREGRLAASVNHPHTVCVYGIEDASGILAIVMELMVGKTLEDCVEAHGPLQPSAAVAHLLQVIAGLEAAEAAGVLHRDVKPSNCFLDREGAVKIGDFGLSISTAPTDETRLTTVGTMLGTPSFAAPEQLRGEPLDVRADIYSVGATLYYLLTGQPPFARANLMEVLTAVAKEAPRPPHELNPQVHPRLSAVVLRCLDKRRKSRYPNYATLARALAPFAPVVPRPATLGRRVIAGLIDVLLFTGLVSTQVTRSLPWYGTALAGDLTAYAMLVVCGLTIDTLYLGTVEGLWGTSPGKWLCRLRVIDARHGPPGLSRGLRRAVVFAAMLSLPNLVPFIGIGSPHALLEPSSAQVPRALMLLFGPLALLPVAALFASARRGNGFAAIHDLASGTRVTETTTTMRRRVARRGPAAAVVPPVTAEHLGPYMIVEPLAPLGDRWRLGFDPRLHRPVWLHVVPEGTPAVASGRRDLARAGRLRWLAGRRSSSGGAWDAYEALDGQPLLELLRTPQPWSAVRGWLLDLARELNAAAQDGNQPALSLDHVWITRGGAAKLLDTPASMGPLRTQALTPQRFLHEVALASLGDAHTGAAPLMLPLHARQFLERLASVAPPALDVVVGELSALMTRPAEITWQRRLASVLLVGCLTIVSVIIFAMLALSIAFGLAHTETPGAASPIYSLGGFELGPSARRPHFHVRILSLVIAMLVPMALASSFKGVGLRALGFIVVSRDGVPASRLRMLSRTLITWSPLLLVFVVIPLFFRSPYVLHTGEVLMLLGAIWTVLSRNRGPQDWLAGTYVVPE